MNPPMYPDAAHSALSNPRIATGPATDDDPSSCRTTSTSMSRA